MGLRLALITGQFVGGTGTSSSGEPAGSCTATWSSRSSCASSGTRSRSARSCWAPSRAPAAAAERGRSCSRWSCSGSPGCCSGTRRGSLPACWTLARTAPARSPWCALPPCNLHQHDISTCDAAKTPLCQGKPCCILGLFRRKCVSCPLFLFTQGQHACISCAAACTLRMHQPCCAAHAQQGNLHL